MPIISIDDLEKPSSNKIIPIDQMENNSKPGLMDKVISNYGDAFNDLKDITGGVAKAATHPWDTFKAVGNAALHPIDTVKAVGEGLSNKYGSFEKAKESIIHKPFTTITDASMLAGGVGATLGKVGEVGNLPKVAAAGKGMVEAASVPFQAGGEAAKVVSDKIQSAAKSIPDGLKKSSYGMMNSIVRQLPKEFRYGQNAGRGAVKEGITGHSAEDIAAKADARIKEIGPQGDALASTVNTTDDYGKAISVIDNKIKELQKNAPRENKTTIQRLENSKRDLLGAIEDADGNIIGTEHDLSNMTPTEALNFKRKYEYVTQWKGLASDDAVVNSTLQASRRVLKDQLNKNVPGLKEWNDRYGDLAVLKTAAQREAVYQEAGRGLGNMINKGLRATGGASAIWSLVHGNMDGFISSLAAIGVKEAVGNPIVRSNIAQILYKLSEADKAKVFKTVPWLQAQAKNIMSSINNRPGQPTNYYTPPQKMGELPAPAPKGLPNKTSELSGPQINMPNPQQKLPFYSMDESGRIKGNGFLLGEKRLTAREANDKLIMAEKPVDAMGNMEAVSHQDQIDNIQARAAGAKDELKMLQAWRKDIKGVRPEDLNTGEMEDVKNKLRWAHGKIEISKKAQEFFGQHPEAWPVRFNGSPDDAYRQVLKDITENRGSDYIGYLRGLVASAKKSKLK